jgi:hypothetical protein
MIPALYRAEPGFLTKQAAKVVARAVARKRGARWAIVYYRDALGHRRIVAASR